MSDLFIARSFSLSLFFCLSLNFGGYSLGVTPLPIPNREVKPQHADGTACASVWESRSLPNFNLITPVFYRGFFYFLSNFLGSCFSLSYIILLYYQLINKN